MTAGRKYTKERCSLFLILSAVIISFNFSTRLSALTREGLALCFNSVIGSVFPFMILGDLLSSNVELNDSSSLTKAFRKLFGINENAIPAFILGQICGFPIGAKIAFDQFIAGRISRDELERIIGFSNNASPAFIIAGIGASMRGFRSDGIVLYIIMVISSIITGIIFGIGRSPKNSAKEAQKYSFSLTTSVRDASLNTVNICGFITLFPIISGLFTEYLKFPFPVIFLEITSAANLLSEYRVAFPVRSFVLTAFAISFSGICVHLQVKSILGKEISLKRYYLAKIISGVISMLLALIYIKLK